jgi:hypothetical protein
VKERLDKHDKQISSIRELVKEGMQLVVQTRKDIRALSAAQKRTEENLQLLINTMRHAGNGHDKKKIDIQ